MKYLWRLLGILVFVCFAYLSLLHFVQNVATNKILYSSMNFMALVANGSWALHYWRKLCEIFAEEFG